MMRQICYRWIALFVVMFITQHVGSVVSMGPGEFDKKVDMQTVKYFPLTKQRVKFMPGQGTGGLSVPHEKSLPVKKTVSASVKKDSFKDLLPCDWNDDSCRKEVGELVGGVFGVVIVSAVIIRYLAGKSSAEASDELNAVKSKMNSVVQQFAENGLKVADIDIISALREKNPTFLDDLFTKPGFAQSGEIQSEYYKTIDWKNISENDLLKYFKADMNVSAAPTVGEYKRWLTSRKVSIEGLVGIDDTAPITYVGTITQDEAWKMAQKLGMSQEYFDSTLVPNMKKKWSGHGGNISWEGPNGRFNSFVFKDELQFEVRGQYNKILSRAASRLGFGQPMLDHTIGKKVLEKPFVYNADDVINMYAQAQGLMDIPDGELITIFKVQFPQGKGADFYRWLLQEGRAASLDYLSEWKLWFKDTWMKLPLKDWPVRNQVELEEWLFKLQKKGTIADFIRIMQKYGEFSGEEIAGSTYSKKYLFELTQVEFEALDKARRGSFSYLERFKFVDQESAVQTLLKNMKGGELKNTSTQAIQQRLREMGYADSEIYEGVVPSYIDNQLAFTRGAQAISAYLKEHEGQAITRDILKGQVPENAMENQVFKDQVYPKYVDEIWRTSSGADALEGREIMKATRGIEVSEESEFGDFVRILVELF